MFSYLSLNHFQTLADWAVQQHGGVHPLWYLPDETAVDEGLVREDHETVVEAHELLELVCLYLQGNLYHDSPAALFLLFHVHWAVHFLNRRMLVEELDRHRYAAAEVSHVSATTAPAALVLAVKENGNIDKSMSNSRCESRRTNSRFTKKYEDYEGGSQNKNHTNHIFMEKKTLFYKEEKRKRRYKFIWKCIIQDQSSYNMILIFPYQTLVNLIQVYRPSILHDFLT